MEPLRRASLVQATIAEIGRAQSLDVTVGQIAKTAGMSTALAHHYFGGKNQIFLAAMRYILNEYGAQVRLHLSGATTSRARAEAIIIASFDQTCFAPATVSAWMTLYSAARTQPETARLLTIYQRRLHSNLVYNLRPLVGDRADAAAERIAGLIDGLYLRQGLNQNDDSGAVATGHVLALLQAELENQQ